MSYPSFFSFLQKKPGKGLVVSLSLLLSFGIFAWFVLGVKVMEPDLREHLKLSRKLITGELIIGHPTFFFLIQLLSGFSGNLKAELFSVWIICSVSQYFKIRLSLSFLKDIFKTETNYLVFFLVLVIQLVIPNTLITKHYIINNISPNYFHNGTLLLAWPFILLFFRESLLFLEDGERRRIFKMILLGLIMVTIKPSFLFCWIPVMPFFVLYKEGPGRKLLGILQVAVFLVLVIFFQSQWLKNSSIEFKIVFAPFFFFGSIENHLLVILSGLSFPLVLFIFCFRDFVREKLNLLLFLFFIQGLVLSFCFYDVIRGFISPNMTWQSSIIAYFWFLFSVYFVEKLWNSGRWLTSLIPLLILAVHLMSAMRYFQFASLIRSFFI